MAGRSRFVPGLKRTLAALALALLAALPARAQTIIRDAEIEHALRDLAKPLILAAGLSPAQIKIMLLEDSTLNAFVLDGQHLFLHTGLVLKMESAAQLQAVLAHEIAHIANGHITRRMGNLRSANSAAGMGLLLALAAGAAGADGKATAGIALGTAGSAMRVFLSHTRAEEASADQSGARYMALAGVDPQAAVEVQKMFAGQELLSSTRQDPYALTHPLSRDRLRALEGFVAAYGGTIKTVDTAAAEDNFARIHGKLSAFTQSPAWTLRRVGKDTSDIATMRRAIAHHRTPNLKDALAEVNRLLASRPADPYAHELKGQILLESRQFPAAAAAYAQAAALAPKEPQILAGHGRALLALDTAESNRQALSVLEVARERDPHDPRMLRDLAVAYAKAGNNGMASLATAERYAVLGRLKDAATHATRAEDLLPQGAPGWLRAQDILRAAETAENRR